MSGMIHQVKERAERAVEEMKGKSAKSGTMDNPYTGKEERLQESTGIQGLREEPHGIRKEERIPQSTEGLSGKGQQGIRKEERLPQSAHGERINETDPQNIRKEERAQQPTETKWPSEKDTEEARRGLEMESETMPQGKHAEVGHAGESARTDLSKLRLEEESKNQGIRRHEIKLGEGEPLRSGVKVTTTISDIGRDTGVESGIGKMHEEQKISDINREKMAHGEHDMRTGLEHAQAPMAGSARGIGEQTVQPRPEMREFEGYGAKKMEKRAGMESEATEGRKELSPEEKLRQMTPHDWKQETGHEHEGALPSEHRRQPKEGFQTREGGTATEKLSEMTPPEWTGGESRPKSAEEKLREMTPSEWKKDTGEELRERGLAGERRFETVPSEHGKMPREPTGEKLESKAPTEWSKERELSKEGKHTQAQEKKQMDEKARTGPVVHEEYIKYTMTEGLGEGIIPGEKGGVKLHTTKAGGMGTEQEKEKAGKKYEVGGQ